MKKIEKTDYRQHERNVSEAYGTGESKASIPNRGNGFYEKEGRGKEWREC